MFIIICIILFFYYLIYSFMYFYFVFLLIYLLVCSSGNVLCGRINNIAWQELCVYNNLTRLWETQLLINYLHILGYLFTYLYIFVNWFVIPLHMDCKIFGFQTSGQTSDNLGGGYLTVGNEELNSGNEN